MRLLPEIAVLPIVALAVLSSCASPPVHRPKPIAPGPVPAPAPQPAVPPAMASDWRDWPYTPGDWTYRAEARGSIALFGLPGAEPQFAIRCDLPTRVVTIARTANAQTPVPMTIRTSSQVRSLNSQPFGTTLAASVQPRDGLLEAIGFSRGRFIVEQPGLPVLVLPAWAEIERVTEDCRV